VTLSLFLVAVTSSKLPHKTNE